MKQEEGWFSTLLLLREHWVAIFTIIFANWFHYWLSFRIGSKFAILWTKSPLTEFQNIKLYKYFNTNNIWIDLKEMKKIKDANNNLFLLPLILNAKEVMKFSQKQSLTLSI